MVMGHGVMGVRHSKVGVSDVAALAAHHECDDAGQVRLKSQDLQIHHQLDMVFMEVGDPCRARHQGQRDIRFLLFSTVDTAFDVTDGIKVLLKFAAVTRTEILT